MESLRSILEKVTHKNERAKKLRRYIVAEAVYQVSPLIRVLDITFCFRAFSFLSFMWWLLTRDEEEATPTSLWSCIFSPLTNRYSPICVLNKKHLSMRPNFFISQNVYCYLLSLGLGQFSYVPSTKQNTYYDYLKFIKHSKEQDGIWKI